MSASPRASVIVPTRNRAPLLRRCLQFYSMVIQLVLRLVDPAYPKYVPPLFFFFIP